MFLIILQIYTTASKFIKNKHQPTPTAVTHGGKMTTNGRVQGVGPAAPYRRAPRW
jgi:hypothetical protein